MALNVITANTLQTSSGVLSVQMTDPGLIESQTLALLESYPVRAIKIGMLGSAAAVRAVASVLEDRSDLFVVLDPVLFSTSGHELLDAKGIESINRILMPCVNLVTPNRQEVRYIDVPLTCATLEKGGHFDSQDCCDKLYQRGELLETYNAPRVVTRNDRGTGCSLSSGIAAYVARGEELRTAIRLAKEALQRSLEANSRLEFEGKGPSFFKVYGFA